MAVKVNRVDPLVLLWKILNIWVRAEERGNPRKSSKAHWSHVLFLLTGLLGKEIGVTERFGRGCLVIDDRILGRVLRTCFPWAEEPEQAERAQLLDDGLKSQDDLNKQKQGIKKSTWLNWKEIKWHLLSLFPSFLGIKYRIENRRLRGPLDGQKLHSNPDVGCPQTPSCALSQHASKLQHPPKYHLLDAVTLQILKFCSFHLLWL